jgi:hypothetical protein
LAELEHHEQTSFHFPKQVARKLIKAGYLERGLCNDAVAVANAIAQRRSRPISEHGFQNHAERL